MSAKLDNIIAGLSPEEKDSLCRGAILAMARMGEEFEWDSGTIDLVAAELHAVKPASLPSFTDQNEEDEDFWTEV